MSDSITVKIKTADKTYSHKFPLTSLDQVQLSHDDKTLKALVDEACKGFKDIPEEIKIKVSFVW